MKVILYSALLTCASPVGVEGPGEPPLGPAGANSPGREPIAAVRVARDRVLSHSTKESTEESETAPTEDSRLARAGDLVFPGTAIETGRAGWAEIQVLGAGRVRLSASTRVTLEHEGSAHIVRLSGGRVWIQRGRRGSDPSTVEIHLPHAFVVVEEKSSVIVEHARTAGGLVAVRAGGAWLRSPDHAWTPVAVPRDRVAAIAPERIEERPIARVGGAGISELVVLEAQDGLGDLTGVRAFLLERIARSSLRALERRGLSEIVRGAAEISGADGGPSGAAIEAAVRPAPFFEDEVPPKGPNVRVEVTFGDE